MKTIFTKHITRIALVLALAVSSQAAFAEPKIGFLDSNRLFNESQMAQSAQNRLQNEFSNREQEINSIGEMRQKKLEEFQRDFPTLSDAQKEKRQQEIVNLEQQFLVKRNSYQQDLSKRRQEELQKMLKKADSIINAIVKQENFDIILNDAVYVKPEYDITDRVIKSLNGG